MSGVKRPAFATAKAMFALQIFTVSMYQKAKTTRSEEEEVYDSHLSQPHENVMYPPSVRRMAESEPAHVTFTGSRSRLQAVHAV